MLSIHEIFDPLPEAISNPFYVEVDPRVKAEYNTSKYGRLVFDDVEGLHCVAGTLNESRPNYDPPVPTFNTDCFFDLAESIASGNISDSVMHSETISKVEYNVKWSTKIGDIFGKTMSYYETVIFSAMDIPLLLQSRGLENFNFLNPAPGTITRAKKRNLIFGITCVVPPGEDGENYIRQLKIRMQEEDYTAKIHKYDRWDDVPRNVFYYVGGSGDKAVSYNLPHFLGFEFNPYSAINHVAKLVNIETFPDHIKYSYYRHDYVYEGTYRYVSYLRWGTDVTKRFIDENYVQQTGRKKKKTVISDIFHIIGTHDFDCANAEYGSRKKLPFVGSSFYPDINISQHEDIVFDSQGLPIDLVSKHDFNTRQSILHLRFDNCGRWLDSPVGQDFLVAPCYSCNVEICTNRIPCRRVLYDRCYDGFVNFDPGPPCGISKGQMVAECNSASHGAISVKIFIIDGVKVAIGREISTEYMWLDSMLFQPCVNGTFVVYPKSGGEIICNVGNFAFDSRYVTLGTTLKIFCVPDKIFDFETWENIVDTDTDLKYGDLLDFNE